MVPPEPKLPADFKNSQYFENRLKNGSMAPPDPQLAPHGLKKFPRVFDEPLGRQTLHLGI